MSFIDRARDFLGLKFTPASSEVNWQRVETLVHGPGAGEDKRTFNSAVFACLQVIATSYPEPPLTVFRQLDDGQDEKMIDSIPTGSRCAQEMRRSETWSSCGPYHRR
jgi:hypothetical protein